MKVRIGIDIGKSGALARFVEDGLTDALIYMKTPDIGGEIDTVKLGGILAVWSAKSSDLHCCIEDVRSIYGASAGSNFQFGRSLGIVEGLLQGLHIPFTKVPPKTWQKQMWMGVDLITKQVKGKAKNDTKAMSLIAAKRLYPEVTFLATEKSSVPHDGIVDAVLIATYCKRNF